MKLPIALFLKGIAEKKVYYFSSSKLNTKISHYFICVLKISNDTLFLVCCTSDKNDKRKQRAEMLGLHQTLVPIDPDNENGLKKESYVDCNSIFEYSIADFKNIYENDVLLTKGEINESHYSQIIQGLLASPQISENIKEILQNKIDI